MYNYFVEPSDELQNQFPILLLIRMLFDNKFNGLFHHLSLLTSVIFNICKKLNPIIYIDQNTISAFTKVIMQPFVQNKVLKQISGIVQWICKTHNDNLHILIDEFNLRLKEITFDLTQLIEDKLQSLENTLL